MADSAGRAVSAQDLKSIEVGVFAGLFACLAYALLVLAPLPQVATTTLAAFFGPALGVASLGLRCLLDLKTPLVSSALGSLLNALAGALFTAMALVQLAVVYSAPGGKAPAEAKAIWLGLDVAWDAYIGLGTPCFGLAMLKHPRFGRALGVPGIAIAVALLALNLWTFPAPPVNVGLVDVGPAVGLWYLLVFLRAWGSLSWARGLAAPTTA
jgi:hypothetical protein